MSVLSLVVDERILAPSGIYNSITGHKGKDGPICVTLDSWPCVGETIGSTGNNGRGKIMSACMPIGSTKFALGCTESNGAFVKLCDSICVGPSAT